MAYVAVSRAAEDAKIFTDNAERLGVVLSRNVSHEQALEPGLDAPQMRKAVDAFRAEVVRQSEAFANERAAETNVPEKKIEPIEPAQEQKPAQEHKVRHHIGHGLGIGF